MTTETGHSGDHGPNDAGARLDAALARLPRAVEPPHDLWPRIEAGLEAGGAPPVAATPSRPWLWQLAAAVLLVVTSSAITAVLVQRGSPPAPLADTAPVTPRESVEVRRTSFQTDYAPGPEYYAARQQMLDTLARRLDQLPPETRVEIAGNLAEIRRGADKIAAALAEQPGDPLLEELLLNAYQDELAMLANVDQLTRGNGARSAADSKVML
jgi:hypothetical protein